MSAKKKVLAAASYVMVAALAIGGTVAYFTDKEDAVNVMTMGAGVDIVLNEQQRSDGPGSDLEDFEQGKELLPVTGSAQGAKDDWGLSADINNYVDKIVTVENTGTTEAYYRVMIAVPAALENANNAEGPLHWNFGNRFDATRKGTYNSSDANSPYYQEFDDQWKTAGVSITIGGVAYNMYTFTGNTTLTAGEVSPAVLTGFYLDAGVDYDDETGKYTFNGKTIDYDLNDVIVPVQAQAVQAAGFTTAEEAFTASGLPANPWAANEAVVASEDAITKASGAALIKENVTLENATTDLNNTVAMYLDDATISAERSDSSGADKYSTLTVYGDVTIGGTGSVENTGSGYAISVRDENASLTITGGTYSGATTAINVVKGNLVITGGTFIDTNADGGTIGSMIYKNGHYLINCIDGNYQNGTATVTIKGGTFKNWDPSNNASEGAGTNFVAEGYKVVSETKSGDVWYTVVKAD